MRMQSTSRPLIFVSISTNDIDIVHKIKFLAKNYVYQVVYSDRFVVVKKSIKLKLSMYMYN